jgi:beta-mannosidase
MKNISLDGVWTLTYFADDAHGTSAPPAPGGAGESVEAHVPGNVELDLERAGRLPDLFYAANIYRLQELEGHEWWYQRTFEVPASFAAKRLTLLFCGLDCLAEIWINGTRIGTTDNMLVEHALDVTTAVRTGAENAIGVRIRSAVRAARGFDYSGSTASLETNQESLFVRKAPHMYGWDITPRAISAGIWRSVELRAHDEAEIAELYYHTLELDGADALLGVHWQIRLAHTDQRKLRLRFVARTPAGAVELDHIEPARTVAGLAKIRVRDARTWWPRGYGEPATYLVRCELLADNEVLDAREDRVGIRTVELERTDVTDERGGQFLFRVNGVPIMCKGSNWVPLDAFHSRDAQRYTPALELFDDLGCNIIRCWGGNVYEDHAFFEYCDTHGMMVWQDFAFACAIYPQDLVFLARVREEAIKVVRKLRNHPSILLWSGDNEVDEFYLRLGRDPGANRISREVLPAVCAEHDPHRPYLPSSPYASPPAAERYLRSFRPGPVGDTGGRTAVQAREQARRLMPEQHLWGPRDYFKSPFYASTTAHFASEIGYHGCPNVSSLQRFLSPKALWPWQDNDEWRVHAADQVPAGGRYSYRIKLMADQVGELFGSIPDDLHTFVLASQASQAEAKKFFVESFRMRKWRRTGIIWWNVLDCWPQFSDAVVDYYFAKKLAYWYLKRSQLPVCLAVDEPENWHCGVVACNDTRLPAGGSFAVTDADSGGTLLGGAFSVDANSCRSIGRIRVSHGEHRMLLVNWEIDGRRYGNHYCLGKPPLDVQWYLGHLERIAALEPAFDAGTVGR